MIRVFAVSNFRCFLEKMTEYFQMYFATVFFRENAMEREDSEIHHSEIQTLYSIPYTLLSAFFTIYSIMKNNIVVPVHFDFYEV